MAEINDPVIETKQEQLWAQKIALNNFEICCIPFFVYNLALGDEVETDEDFLVRKISKPSGQYTFRVWAKNTPNKERDLITIYLSNNNYIYEWYSENLFSISAQDKSSAQSLSNYLMKQERKGYLIYETGKQ